ncbi:hypothetical protein HN587_03625 [Candidatus Woesearchaeota archaeon]|nr:hypothetical protein [Candidatus Woesearchaeota archaeon]
MNVEKMKVKFCRMKSSSNLKGKKFLINAGPTRGKIDRVRYIENRSSGELGIKIANELYLRGAEVTLVYGPGRFMPPSYLKVLNVETPVEMLEEMKTLVRKEEFDAIIYAAAVLDYVPSEFIDKKIRSGTGLNVKFIPTQKIIWKMREELKQMDKKPFQITFKLETGKSEEEFKEKVYLELLKNHSNLVVANLLEEVSCKSHRAVIVTPEQGYSWYGDKLSIAKGLADHLENRLNVTRFGIYKTSKKIIDVNEQKLKSFLEKFRWVGGKLAMYSALPKWDGGTFGNISVSCGGGFLITAKKADKTNLGQNDLVYVTDVDVNCNLEIYQGKKEPSSESLMHYLIYLGRPDVGAIIHTHDVNLLSMQNIPSTKVAYPCGTMELATEAIKFLGEGVVVNLLNHGQIIVGKDLNIAMNNYQKLKSGKNLE